MVEQPAEARAALHRAGRELEDPRLTRVVSRGIGEWNVTARLMRPLFVVMFDVTRHEVV